MKHDYQYGKLKNNGIEYAPYPLKVNGYDVYGAKEEQYREQGYKKVVTKPTAYEENTEYKMVYTETENEITVENIKVETAEQI